MKHLLDHKCPTILDVLKRRNGTTAQVPGDWGIKGSDCDRQRGLIVDRSDRAAAD